MNGGDAAIAAFLCTDTRQTRAAINESGRRVARKISEGETYFMPDHPTTFGATR